MFVYQRPEGYFSLGQVETINQDSEQSQHGDIITITMLSTLW